MSKMRIAVLRGGPSSEYDISLKTGGAVLSGLNEDKYIPVDVFIDKGGVWHVRGLPKDPSAILENVDTVFNAMHGGFGEDGTVQKILERYAVPYTGSRASASALCMNKFLTKQTLAQYEKELDVHFAKHFVLYPGEDSDASLRDVLSSLELPVVVKPIVGGSSVDVHIIDDYDGLRDVVSEILEYARGVLVEEYILGKEATCGVVERFRGESIYAMLPIEIRPDTGHRFFDYEAKYKNASKEICPGNFSVAEKEKIQHLSREVHRLLGLRHYSRSDFIVTPSGIYFLEVNTLPGLTPESLVPKALKAVGCTFPQFLDHLVGLSFESSQ